MKSVVLLSGGLDSTTLLYKAMEETKVVACVSVDYGQKHKVELDQAREVLKYAVGLGDPVYHHVVKLDPRGFIGAGSALIEGDMPYLTYEELAEAEGPSATYVPFRNANLIAQAVSLSMSIHADEVWYGPHAEDARAFAYPDCTPEFNGAIAAAVYIGTYHKVQLRTPFQWMSKADIVRLGLTLGVPFELTHSCYEGARPACGRCPTCMGRLAAFSAAGAIDPLEYDPWTTVGVAST